MTNAIAIVAHHDDHALWMGGTIQRTSAVGWKWTLVAMCVPEAHRAYFNDCCSKFGAVSVRMDFVDCSKGEAFSKNDRTLMQDRLTEAVQGQNFDWVFTHSRSDTGEYWFKHPNHVEVRETTLGLVNNGVLGRGTSRLVYFAYDVIYGSHTATCADPKTARFVVPLSYPELMTKCGLCIDAPDLEGSLRGLAFPCPNPEGFEGEGLDLPQALEGDAPDSPRGFIRRHLQRP